MLRWRGALSLLFALLLVSTAIVDAQENPGAPSTDQAQPDSTGMLVSAHAGPDSLYPDPSLTPGAVFNGVTADQVCAMGYARTVRNVSRSERVQVYAEYGVKDVPGADEVDHFIPLELGGSNDITNLWPEPYAVPGAHEKDKVENYLHEQVCNGTMALDDAQRMIANDWYAVYVGLPASTTSVSGARPVAPTATVTTSVPSREAVTFAAVAGAPPGGRASVTVETTPGATCSVQYVTPAGSKSTAAGQGANVSKTVGPDGQASWSWDIGPSTGSGSGSVTANCSTGTATTPIIIS
jgi:hypothetical protein